jgi:hypothetical protein
MVSFELMVGQGSPYCVQGLGAIGRGLRGWAGMVSFELMVGQGPPY